MKENRIAKFKEELGVMYIEDVSEVLGISKDTAYKLFNDPAFPKCTIGKSHFVTVDALNEYLKQRR